MKDGLPVGFAVLEVRTRRGDWFVGVRESHRRRGVGRALAATALGALLAREMAPFATAWALDPIPGAFLRALGFQVERTYLYLEKPL
jgi:GNAT superfamily N-acetyltransferase